MLSPSFTAAELAIRLHARDPEAGLRALTELAAGRTIEAVRTALADTPARADAAGERSAPLRERRRLLKRCEDALAAQAGRLFGRGSTVRRRPALRLFRRIGFEVFNSAGALACSADLYKAEASTASRDPFEGLPQSVPLSFYLPSFLLLFVPGTADDPLDWVERALVTLDAPWIGIAAFGEDDEIELLRPAGGRPSPDRTADYQRLRSALSQGKLQPQGDDPLA